MNINKNTRVFLIVIFVLAFLGCTISTDFYVQNMTQTRKKITINYKENILSKLNEDSYGHFSFNYENGIVEPKAFKRDENLKRLEKIKIDSTSITIIVDPNSTVRILKTLNYNWNWNIRNIEIDDENYDIHELEKKAEKVKDDYIFKIK